jgi:mono/diheme cytochrome c family protein
MKFLPLLLLSVVVLYSDTKFELGESIYKRTCQSCHGVDGNAETKMRLIVRPRSLQKSILTQDQSYEIIKNGAYYWGAGSDIMPSFKSVYSEDKLRAVAYYITKKFNPNVEKKIQNLYAKSDTTSKENLSKMIQDGKKVYRRECASCHGLTARGDGKKTRDRKNPVYPYDLTKTLLSSKQMFLYVKYGGKFWGTDKNDMPSWKHKYDDKTLRSVVLYIENTFREGKK